MKASLEVLADKIKSLMQEKECLIIAIDGRCASGKTTVSSKLAELFDCNVFHMDDFFLRPEQRTQERLNTPGGNVDRERFLQEVLTVLYGKNDVHYRKFDCKKMCLSESCCVPFKKLNIIEGSYSCHPEFKKYYDLCVFITVDENTQLERIKERDGEDKLKIFKSKWIPMEEKYFEYFGVKNKCDIVLE